MHVRAHLASMLTMLISLRYQQLVIQFGSYHEIYDPNFYMAFYILGLFLITPAHLYWSFRVSHTRAHILHVMLRGTDRSRDRSGDCSTGTSTSLLFFKLVQLPLRPR